MKASVIIPVYNVAPFLRMCVGSVVSAAARGDSEVECICVDDGSTDGSAAILDECRDAGNLRFKIVHQPNSGVSAARNTGLTIASGDWIVFLDADDVVRDSLFADLERLLSRVPSADVIGYRMRSISEERAEAHWLDQPLDMRPVDLAGEIGDVFAQLSVCGFAYRRGLLADLRFPPLTVGEDQVFLMAVLSRARSCVLTSRDLYGYRFRLGSVTRTQVAVTRLADMLSAQMEMFRLLADSGKRLGRRFVRCRSFAWLEALPCQLFDRREEPGVEAVWNRWLDSMQQASEFPAFESWQRRWAARISRRRSTTSVRLFLWLTRLHRSKLWYNIGNVLGVWS